jgi:serine/threonine-protein kinase SRPK3
VRTSREYIPLVPNYELPCLERITAANPEHPGYQHCLMLRDNFTCSSPLGDHVSLVTDVLCSSNTMTLQVSRPNGAFPAHVIKRIVKQTLLGLDYLHRECGVIHTGGSPPPNVAT